MSTSAVGDLVEQGAPAFEAAIQVMKTFLHQSTGLHGLSEIRLRGLGAFVRAFWSWIARVAEQLALVPYRLDAYRLDGGSMLMTYGKHHSAVVGRFGIAYGKIVAAWAAAEPTVFVIFAIAAADSNLAVLHALLAEVYVAIAMHQPRAVPDYLLGDVRRFRLGDHSDSEHVTRRLITAAASHLDQPRPSRRSRCGVSAVTSILRRALTSSGGTESSGCGCY